MKARSAWGTKPQKESWLTRLTGAPQPELGAVEAESEVEAGTRGHQRVRDRQGDAQSGKPQRGEGIGQERRYYRW